MTDDNRKALRGAITNMPDMELPENMRVPLHSLRADTGYLFGRTAADGSVAGMMQQAADNYLSQIEEAAYRMMGEAECLRTALAASEAKVEKAREAMEEAANWHEYQIMELRGQMVRNNEYRLRSGDTDTTADDNCRAAIREHTMAAAAIRALKVKP